MLREYIKYLKEYWQIAEVRRRLLVINFFTSVLYKSFAIVRPFVAALIVDALLRQDVKQTYYYILIFFLVYMAFRLAKYLDRRVFSRNVNYSYLKMHDKIFNKLVNVDSNFTREVEKGEFMNTINSDLISVSEIGNRVSQSIATIIQLLVVLVIVGRYSLICTAIIAISLIIYICVRNRADRKMNHYWAKTRREDDNYSDFIGQVATGLQEVKTFNMLPKLRRKLSKIQKRYDKAYKKQREQVTVRDNDVNISYYLFQTLIYILLLVTFMTGKVGLDIVIMVAMYHEMAINYTADFVNALNQIRLEDASVKRVQRILKYQPEDVFEFGKTSLDELEGKVEFKDVSLKLDKKPILSNVSFKVKPHEAIAIVGFPGAGKTMLFNLLLRLKQPTKGKILLDDIDIRDFTKEMYTSSIAVANQAPFIFNTSIRKNLNFVNDNVKAQIKACKTAGIHDFIESLPQGYNTILRENASNVSVGQRQMISIARAILTDAEVLLFDDVTTALDPKTTARIPKLIEKLKKNHTVIMITKNPELMAVVDRVVVLVNGKIEAIGTREVVAEKSKTFRALQFAPDEEENV